MTSPTPTVPRSCSFSARRASLATTGFASLFALVALAACKKDAKPTGTPDAGDAALISLGFEAGWGPCESEAPDACRRFLHVDAAGSIQLLEEGECRTGTLSTAELAAFVTVATDPDVLDMLGDDCEDVIDYGETISIETSDGTYESQSLAGCEGAAAEALHAQLLIARNATEPDADADCTEARAVAP